MDHNQREWSTLWLNINTSALHMHLGIKESKILEININVLESKIHCINDQDQALVLDQDNTLSI